MAEPNPRLWYVRTGGRMRGPFTLEQLRAERDRKQLTPAAELSEDRKTWVLACSLHELFPPGFLGRSGEPTA